MSLFIKINSKRPTKRDACVTAKAAELGLEHVMKWLRQGGDEVPEDEVDGIKKDLDKVLGSWDLDAYKLAKEFDEMGWEPDADLVDVLSSGWHWVSQAHDKALSEWVRIHNPPLLPEGLAVAFKDGGRKVTGKIIRVDAVCARYTVNSPELGHGPGSGRILDYENLSAIEEEPQKVSEVVAA